MVPIPQAASFEALNTYLLEQCRADDERTVAGQGQAKSIGRLWSEERVLLRPLPLRQFECCVTRTATLTPYSQLNFETNRYSVPVEQARRQLILKAYPFQVQILDAEKVIASHPRSYEREQDIFNPLHYLPLLEQRPGAFEYAKPLRRWREDWPPVYHRLLAVLKERPVHSPSQSQSQSQDQAAENSGSNSNSSSGSGVKEFVQILALHKEYSAPLVEQAITLALHYGCAQLEGIRQCLYQLTNPPAAAPLLDLSSRPALAAVGGQAVDLACYEQLLLLERPG